MNSAYVICNIGGMGVKNTYTVMSDKGRVLSINWLDVWLTAKTHKVICMGLDLFCIKYYNYKD